VMTSLCRTTP